MTQQISFKNIPQNLRTPLFYGEVDNSKANTASEIQRTLIIGQMTSSGTGAANSVNLCAGSNDAATLAGVNSRLASDVAAYRLNDASAELWIGLLADAGGSAAATGTLTFSGAPTANGSFFFYLGGVRYVLPVATTQTAAQLATALAALVNADPTCPVTASVASAVVTFTADSKGPQGNDYPMVVSFYGLPSEPTVPGLAAALVQMSGGTGAPVLTSLLVALGDQTFDAIVCPYSDTTTLDALKVFLNDSTGRWSYSQQAYGHVFTAQSGTLSALVTFGNARNNQHETCWGIPPGSPTPVSAWAAAKAGTCMPSLRIDPARPLQTLVVAGVIAPPLANRFVLLDRNTLLYNGISTFTVGADGTVSIENVITTYQKNAFGSADDSYLQIETLFNLVFQLRYLRTRLTSRFPRMKLADNGTPAGAGSAIVTPNIARAELISAYADLVDLGLAQDAEAFAASLVVQRNALNPNRLDVLFPTYLIDQLRTLALLAQFRLQV
jgi:phage tail sheath gpL-like